MNYPSWSNYFLDVQYVAGVWYAANPVTGDRENVDAITSDISELVRDEDQQWCRDNQRVWLHKKHGHGRTVAVKKIPEDDDPTRVAFVKVWIGDHKKIHGHLR